MQKILLFILSLGLPFSLVAADSGCQENFQIEDFPTILPAKGRLIADYPHLKSTELIRQINAVIADLENKMALRDFEGINQWLNTEERRAYFYEAYRDNASYTDIYNKVIDEGPQFKKYHKNKGVPGSLITYSFEKETWSEGASFYFYPKDMSFSQWEKMSFQEKATYYGGFNYYATPFNDVFNRTELAPSYLGAISVEHAKEGTMIELKSRTYEISSDVLINQVKEIAKDTKETHSFHIHAVFQIPTPEFQEEKFNFYKWYYHLNSYLYYKGLEEGLHSSHYAREANYNRVVQAIENHDEYKFSSLGFRPGKRVYGIENTDLVTTIGLEFRDATRKIENYQDYIKKMTHSLANRIWTKQEHTHIESVPRVLDSEVQEVSFLKKISRDFGLNLDELEEFYYYVPDFVIPFFSHELIKYRNYHGQLNQPVPAHIVRRIIEARTQYAIELKNLITEFKEEKRFRMNMDPDIVKYALRIEITTWAKKAMISELLENY